MSFFVGPPGGVCTVAVWELCLSQNPSSLWLPCGRWLFTSIPFGVAVSAGLAA